MPALYRIVFTRSARRELERLPKKEIERMAKRIHDLASDPRPAGCEKLSGTDFYRVRQGDYRVLYRIDDAERLVDILRIGHRREVYR